MTLEWIFLELFKLTDGTFFLGHLVAFLILEIFNSRLKKKQANFATMEVALSAPPLL